MSSHNVSYTVSHGKTQIWEMSAKPKEQNHPAINAFPNRLSPSACHHVHLIIQRKVYRKARGFLHDWTLALGVEAFSRSAVMIVASRARGAKVNKMQLCIIARLSAILQDS